MFYTVFWEINIFALEYGKLCNPARNRKLIRRLCIPCSSHYIQYAILASTEGSYSCHLEKKSFHEACYRH
jgi:hypothetical protein